MTITTDRPATTTKVEHLPTLARRRVRTRRPAPTAIPHVAQLHYETAAQDETGKLTWTHRGTVVARVAAADQATADFLPYSPAGWDLVRTPTGIDYVDVAVCRVSVMVTDESGAVFTSAALYYPDLAR